MKDGATPEAKAKILRAEVRTLKERVRQLEADAAGPLPCGFDNGVVICMNDQPCPMHPRAAAPRET